MSIPPAAMTLARLDMGWLWPQRLVLLLVAAATLTAATANGGPDVTVTDASGVAALAGTVSAGAQASWSKLDGPGSVTFTPPNAAQTTATLSQAGTYQLRLSASDGAGTAVSDVRVEVVPPAGLTNAEALDGFRSWFNGSDLSQWRQTNGQPAGDAYWSVQPGGVIRHDHGGNHLMSRSEYGFCVVRFEWRARLGTAGFDGGFLTRQPFGSDIFDGQIQMGYRSGSYFGAHGLGGLVYEAPVPQWNDWEFSALPDGSGNVIGSLAVTNLSSGGDGGPGWSGIGTGSGWTTPIDGASTFAPRGFFGFQQESGGYELRNLRIKAVGNQPPVVDAGPDQTVTVGTGFNLAGSVSDDAQSGSAVSSAWSGLSGPGSVSFANANAPATTAMVTTAGTYVLQLASTDGQLRASRKLSIVAGTSAPGAPVITSQPANQQVTAGQTATFSVTAGGNAPLAYQWQRGGNPISGAIASSYTTPATTVADHGSQYFVVVSNSAGTATSPAATLSVSAPVSDGVTHGGFELPATAGFAYTPTGSAWAFTGNAGVQRNGSAFNASIAPEGVQTAFLQGNGTLGTITQTLTITANQSFRLSLKAARRSGQVQPLRITLGGQVLAAAYAPTGDSFEPWTSGTVTLDAGGQVLRLEATNVTGDQSTFIDDVQLTVATAGAGDLNGDGRVDAADLDLVRGQFGRQSGQSGWDGRADLDADQRVDAIDLSMLLRLQDP